LIGIMAGIGVHVPVAILGVSWIGLIVATDCPASRRLGGDHPAAVKHYLMTSLRLRFCVHNGSQLPICHRHIRS
jgi:hypothetical protein